MTSWTPPPLPSRLTASRHLAFVGRRTELETMEAVWTEVEERRRQLVFVGGEPGAGKTRLVAEVAGALHDHGAAVLVGTSSLDAGIPYQPFAEMLDHLFAGAPDRTLSDVLGQNGGALRRLSPHGSSHRRDFPELPPDRGEARQELFDAVARLFRTLTEDRPLVLVLEDIHRAQVPTLAMLEHVVQSCPDTRLLVLATFRTTAPDRSDEVATRVAELHRLEGVRRLDLGGLDTDAIAEFLSLRTGLTPSAARAPAALLRDRTGGNPFFLRELWADLEPRGGLSALRSAARVPASIGDALAARLACLGRDVRDLIELAAVLGDTFELSTLVAAGGSDAARTMAFVDAAAAVGLIEPADPDGRLWSFVHELTRQAVLGSLPPSRRTLLHARAADALERQPPEPALVPRLAYHYLAAHILGYQEQARRYSREAGRLAERSLAFEEAAAWFERAAALPEGDAATRAELLLAAAADHVRACQFSRARAIYEQLATTADSPVRLAAAVGYEDANWRPGLPDPRAADLLSSALEDSALDQGDPRYVRALGSLSRALALAGETDSARQVGNRAVDLARRLGDETTLLHALTASLWHGTTPDAAEVQWERSAEAYGMAKSARDYETLGQSVNFRAMVSYLLGRPDELEGAVSDSQRAARATGQPYYRYVHCCLAHADAFMRGDFSEAERWAEETLNANGAFGDEITEGPHGVQMFMIRRQTGALGEVRRYVNGNESFTGRWVPGLLALYTELGLEQGIRRTLPHLLDRDLALHRNEAQWPMELVFMTEAALALGDRDALRTVRPLLAEYAGMNLVCGTLIATFGSADRFLGRVDAALDDVEAAEEHLTAALDMDRRMRSVVHVAESLAHLALFEAAAGRPERARDLAREARGLAEPIGQGRVLRALEAVREAPGPDGLTEREVEVLRLLAEGLSNQEIAARLYISANTAANHVRKILMKTGAANRTQAAMYAAERLLV